MPRFRFKTGFTVRRYCGKRKVLGSDLRLVTLNCMRVFVCVRLNYCRILIFFFFFSLTLLYFMRWCWQTVRIVLQMIVLARHVAWIWRFKNACKVLSLPTLSKDRFGQVRRRCEDDIKVSLLQTSCKDLMWIYMANVRDLCQDLVRTVLNCRVPWSVSNLTSWGPSVPCVSLFCGLAEGTVVFFLIYLNA
jgi:hypothetical protein